MTLNYGDRVYYVDNGPDDTGTVSVPPDNAGVPSWDSARNVYVTWDDGGQDDFYAPGQLRRVFPNAD